jgi:hypothetical protein
VIDYKESLKKYGELFSHHEAKSDICQWYQNNCRFYNDEVIYKEELYFWQFVKVGIFYIFVLPVILFIWGSIVLIFKVKNGLK